MEDKPACKPSRQSLARSVHKDLARVMATAAPGDGGKGKPLAGWYVGGELALRLK